MISRGLAQLSATSRRRKNNMSDRKPPAVFVVRVHFTNSECRKTTGRIFCCLFVFKLVCKTRSYCLLEQQEPVSQTSRRKRTSLTSVSSARAAPSVGQTKSWALSAADASGFHFFHVLLVSAKSSGFCARASVAYFWLRLI